MKAPRRKKRDFLQGVDKPIPDQGPLSRGNRLLRSLMPHGVAVLRFPLKVHNSSCRLRSCILHVQNFPEQCCFSPIAMEVLRGVSLASSSCSIISQCSSSSSKSSKSSKSCPSASPIVQFQPSKFVCTVFGSLIASVPPSLALDYNEFVTQTEPVQADGTIDFASNPAVLFAGVAAAVAVPLIAFRFLNPQSFGSASPLAAFAALAEPDAQLLDIRAPEDAKASGSPNLKSLRKKLVRVAYKSEDSSFADKVLSKYRDAENTTLYILDELDGNAQAVAQLLANSGFKKAFAITGGVEGWQKNELPWEQPRKGFSLNIGGVKNIFSGSEKSNLVPATLGAAAAAGIGIAVFSEAETVLQLLGSAAFIQIFARKFMFADDREKTIKEIRTFLDTKVAPKEFATELKEVGRVLNPNEGADVNKGARASAAVEEEDKLKVDTVVPELKVADQA